MLSAGMAGLNMAIAFHELQHGVQDTRKILEAEGDREIVLEQFRRFELLLDTYANLLRQEKVKQHEIKDLLDGNMALSNVRFKMHDILVSCPVLVGIYWLDQRWGDAQGEKYIYCGVSNEFDSGPAIIIADNGPGWRHMRPEEMVKPFLTNKPGGMGIGLYYTNMVMEMLGGELALLEPGDLENLPDAIDGAVAALIFKGGEECKK